MRFLTILTAATAAHAVAFAPHLAVAQNAAGTKPSPSTAAPSAKPAAAAPTTAAPAAAAPAAPSTPGNAAPAAGASSGASAAAPKADAPSGAAPGSKASDSPPSPEDAKLACIASFDEAQRERNAGHYLASRAALIQCSEPQCGDVLASECTRMYADVEAATPSVVFSAHDAALNVDRSDVTVSAHGKVLLDGLDGKPQPVDPGQYELTFTAPGATPVKMEVVIRTGEKYRVINVVFPAPTAPTLAVGASSRPQAAPPEASRSIPTLSYVFGGLGVAGVGTFVALRLIGASDYDSMKDTCSPSCLDSDIDNLKLKYTISNVALGVGVASLGAAIVIYAVSPSEAEEPSASVALVPTAGGSSLVFDARF